jgi:uncharacterized protein (TIGR03086 family)
MTDVLDGDRRAVETTIGIVGKVGRDDLDRPTPCAGWTLGTLLAHMIGQHYGFAAAAEGNSQDPAVFADRPVGEQPAADYEAAGRRVIDAFSAPGLLEGTMYLPEVRGGMSLPATMAIGFHLVDYVAHGWDVAKSLGIAADFAPDVLHAALTVAEEVPEEAKGSDARLPFRPSVPTSSADLLDRVVATLGRDPDWTP